MRVAHINNGKQGFTEKKNNRLYAQYNTIKSKIRLQDNVLKKWNNNIQALMIMSKFRQSFYLLFISFSSIRTND